MSLMSISRKDMLRSKLLDKSWYAVKIEKFTESLAGDKSKLFVYEGSVVEKGPALDVPLRWQFSEKAMGFATDFIIACGGEVTEEGGRFVAESPVNMVIDIYNDHKLYNGKMQNNPTNFRKLTRTLP